MEIAQLMTSPVVALRPSETADTAARLLSRGNIGAVPVVDDGGRVVGILTDRDLVVRCMAAALDPRQVPVSRIMTAAPALAQAQEDAEAVAARMARHQVRRMPVIREGVLAGMVSLGDLARTGAPGAAQALAAISRNVSPR